MEDYLTAGTEARALGRESVPAYLREIHAPPAKPKQAEPSQGSLLDKIDRGAPPKPSAPPPIPPGSYRDETPPPPPRWYKKPFARVLLTLLILAGFGAAIFGGVKFMQSSITPTPTLQPTLTVEMLPSKNSPGYLDPAALPHPPPFPHPRPKHGQPAHRPAADQ